MKGIPECQYEKVNENVIFLMAREPLKHIITDLICPKFIFVRTHDTTFDFGMFSVADNN